MLQIIPPTSQLSGKVILPGSKSITNRALLLAALADGVSEIHGALKSDDTKYMIAGLRQLGIEIEEKKDGTTLVVHGKNGKLAESKEKIFLGNAGTATRFLTAAAILMNGETIIDGDAHMRERPIKDLVDALTQLGAKIEYLGKAGCPPLRIISNGKIPGEKIKIRADISSQFLSAIMMVAPLAEKEVQIQFIGKPVSKGYLDLTESVMIEFGQKSFQIKKEKETFISRNTGKTVEITNEFIPIKHQKYLPQKFSVDADASSATYFWAAEKLLNQKIKIENLSQKFWQPDSESKKIIDQFPNLPPKIDGSKFPDAIPTLAVLAAFSKTPTIRFFGIANLRVKECDRIAALVKNLNKIKPGLAQESFRDELIISGTENLASLKLAYDDVFAKTGKPVIIESFDDHRIAMAFFLAGLKIPGIKIDKPDCVAKSFPNFWEIWEQLGVKFLK
ncbi:MAG: 3-phosphoshikimate 1-carboxyvinyltransferase [Patescibacteria group bacterium]